MKYPILLALAVVSLSPVSAQETPAPAPAALPCPVTPVPLPAGLEGWVIHDPVTAATTAGDLAKAQILIGQGATVTLTPQAQVTYIVTPEKPAKPGSMGGLLGFTVQVAGTYRVALGAGAWIDVLRDGKVIASTAHGHGQPCSSIRKTVDFALTPGKYLVQVVGNSAPRLSLMVAHAS
ncbi:MAG: hypothetical protein JWN66_3336 [Sphingomonas bacterium]|uniref:homogentisate 1,2-dioxygenase n=1 Tax=Sphingomonas bacterium TaxID=1895847 RepID=UPI002609E2BB|nr:homogentisate 1,2-dioxygenase [Sphingomonas bacterium]MDB5706220.1 hypothetical protein [Sphingomonas bacterium]